MKNRALAFKPAALQMITASGVTNLFRPLMRGAAVVFMLHRFGGPGHGASSHDPAKVRALLAWLRRENHQLIDLRTLFASLNGEAPPLRRAVAFTIDDGHRDHATVGAPLFAEFDCPVTTFVTTGFLDGQFWFWWDQIQYAFTQTARRSVTLDLGHASVSYDLRGDAGARQRAQDDFTARCKSLTKSGRNEAIRTLAAAMEVHIPQRPPAEYEPMSWDELRACERGGMSFGPHTVTHPFLARLTDAEAREEIVGSWERLKSEAVSAVPVFAYPNGTPGDYGEREFRILRNAGFVGALTAEDGFVTRERHRSPNGPFCAPRFPFPDSLPYLIQQVDGLERFKFLLRGMRSS